ncbi:hypothetical protein TNCV_2549451 [Trichonephila clavipes]|nr:hypothetical protein TNCV_2549451 [Trichonephila clavipes]
MKQSSMSLKLFGMLPMQPFPEHLILLESCANHGGTLPANMPKEQRRAWGIFRRYPTSDNLIAFKRAALARRNTSSMPENLGSSMCLQSHRQLPVNSYGERSKQRMAFIGILTFDIGNFYCFVFVTFRCGQLDWQNIC